MQDKDTAQKNQSEPTDAGPPNPAEEANTAKPGNGVPLKSWEEMTDEEYQAFCEECDRLIEEAEERDARLRELEPELYW